MSVGCRVLRGGTWNNNTNNLRCANRNRNTPDNENNNIGFRCVRGIPTGQKDRLPGQSGAGYGPFRRPAGKPTGRDLFTGTMPGNEKGSRKGARSAVARRRERPRARGRQR